MLTLTPQQFEQLLKQKHKELTNLIDRQLPIIIGKMAVEHFKLNFQNEAWGRDKWKEPKRRIPGTREYKISGAGRTRKILAEGGDLGRSIQYTPESSKVTIHSDLIYAAIHNYGLEGKAWGRHHFKMPQRQFIGEDEELNKKIQNELDKQLSKIIKL
jgi:phage gpG-like protein